MRLLVGLGNPGSEHAGNRHNIGFMAVQAIARRHGFPPWRRRFQGVATEGTIGARARAAAAAGHLHEQVRPRGRRGGAFLQAAAVRHRGGARRDRPAAGEGAGEDRRRHRRPQRPALDHGACRQRLSPRAHRRRSSGREGAGARLRARRFRQGRAAVGRGAVRGHRRQCRAAGARRRRDVPEQGASRHAGEGISNRRNRPRIRTSARYGIRDRAWASSAASSACRMSASRRSSMR